MDQSLKSEADDGQLGGAANTTASSAVASVLPQSASASSLPKLRLTLKVAATPPPDLPSETQSEVKIKRLSGAKAGKPRGRGPNKPKPAPTVQVTEQTQSSTQATTIGPAVVTQSRVMEKKELPAQFAEQIQQLKDLRKLKTRKWTQTQTTSKTISGATLILPIWAREGSFSHMDPPSKTGTNRRGSVDGALNPITGESFPCQEPGCKKVFDAKDKLKRHQVVHRKKAAKLQLKLPTLKLTLSRSEAALPPDPELLEHETAASSFPASELPSEMAMMEDTQSHLESQI